MTAAVASHTLTSPHLTLNLKGSPSGPRSEPTVIPTLSPEYARQEAKEKLALAYRLFHRFHYDGGTAGHITLRDPIDPHSFWLAPFSIPFDHVTASDLLRIDHNGNVLQGGKPGDGQLYNAAGFAIHGALHMARPDLNAAAHAHSLYGKAFAAMGRNLDIASDDAASLAQTIRHYPDFGGVVLADEEAHRICTAMGPLGRAIILQSHGLLTAGETIEEAVSSFVKMESLCKSQLMADAAGRRADMDPAEVERVFAARGGGGEGWWEGRRMLESMERECKGEHRA